MKKLHILIPSLVAVGSGAILPLASCNQIQNKIDSIKISGEHQVIKGNEATYSAEVTVRSDEVDKTVTWSIKTDQDETGSTIDAATGKFTAGNEVGTVTIKATSVVDETKTAEFTINVVSPIESITIGKIDDLNWNNEWTCKATVKGAEGYDQSVTWDIVEPEAAATINPTTGELKTGEKTETITVRATSVVDPTVYGKKTVSVISPIKSITISGETEQYFTQNDTYSAEVSVEGDWSKDVKWSIVQGDVTGSTIDATTGKFTAGSVSGEVTIKATSVADETAYETFTINIKTPVTGVEIVEGSNNFRWGDQFTFSANVSTVEGEYDTSVKWEITTPGHQATIDQDGNFIAGNKNETVCVQASSKLDPTQKAEMVVSIKSPIDSITISGTQALPLAGQITYTADVQVSKEFSKQVTWSIIQGQGTGSKINSATGEFIAGKNPGKVIIRATSVGDPESFTTREVYVTNDNPIKSVTLNSEEFVSFGQSSVVEMDIVPAIEGIEIDYEISDFQDGGTNSTWNASTRTLTAGDTTGVVTFNVNAKCFTATTGFAINVIENVFNYSFNDTKFEATVNGLADPRYTKVGVMPTVAHNGNTYKITSIAASAFASSSVELFNLENATNLTTINREAFEYAKNIKKLYIPKNIKTIDKEVFYGTESLESVYIQKDSLLSSLGNASFGMCTSLQSINIENATSLTQFNPHLFYGCSSLLSLTINKTFKRFYEFSIYDDKRLADIFYEGTHNEWNAITKDYHWCDNVPATVHCKDGDWPI